MVSLVYGLAHTAGWPDAMDSQHRRPTWEADVYGRTDAYGWPTLWMADVMDGRRYGWPTHMEGRPFRADTMDLMDTWEAQRVYQVADD
jgi:hypothetical protein